MRLCLGVCLAFLLQIARCSPPRLYDGDKENGRYGNYPVQKFFSSKIKAPYLNFPIWSPECNDGLYHFITPRGWKVKDPGPMILDSTGMLIWSQHFDNDFGGQAYDLKVQQYKGEDYLTFWLGDDTVRGHGAGHFYMLNSSYDIVHKVGAANHHFADLHEFVITPEGTALLAIFQPYKADTRPFGRKYNDVYNQAIWDCLFQEVDIESGKLLFEWRASEYLNMTHTYRKFISPNQGTREDPFDWFHINSVEKDELGNYLVSSRHLHAVIYIDGRTKEVIWTLGGHDNSFQDLSDGHALNFAWQHDARWVSESAFPTIYTPQPSQKGMTTKLMTIFDNAALDWDTTYGPGYSRVLLLEVTYETPKNSQKTTAARDISARSNTIGDHHTTAISKQRVSLSEIDSKKISKINGTNPAYQVKLIQEFIHPQKVISSTQGSARLLTQGDGQDSHIFVGYGLNAVMTEFHSNGSVLCDAHFAAKTSWETGDVQSYRATKSKWIGRPRDPPTVIVKSDVVYISWNGATEVRAWKLQASSDAESHDWRDVTEVGTQGFETEIPLSTSSYTVTEKFIRVLAIGAANAPLGNGISAARSRGWLTMMISQPFGISDLASMVFLFVLLGIVVAVTVRLRTRLVRLHRRYKTGLTYSKINQ